jgi:HSP20 family molecular chaperone IbpA
MAETTIPQSNAVAMKEEPAPITHTQERYLVPAVDIYENDDGLRLVADVPGMAKDGLDIRVEEGILTIKGKTSWERRPSTSYAEYELYEYFRQFRLSDEVDHEKIGAELKHGVLYLSLPRAERAKPRKIEVKASE